MAKRSRSDSNESSGEALSNLGEQDVPIFPTEIRPLKYASIEPEDQSRETKMSCLLPPHGPLDFSTYSDYDKHYQEVHTNRCRECSRNLPSAHFLQLHITENHDPIIAARRERGERTFACFVEGCDKVCLEWTKRRSHLVDKHGFPRNYDFFIVNAGIDGRTSMLRSGVDSKGHRKSSRDRRSSDVASSASAAALQADSVRVDEKALLGTPASQRGVANSACNTTFKREQSRPDVDVDTLANSMSTLNMIPRSITFGKRKGKSGFAKQ